MKKASGFTKTQEFAHHYPHKRNRQRVASLQRDQKLEMSPWPQTQAVSKAVDINRANWKGTLYYQSECGLYDPRPRLVKHEMQVERAPQRPFTVNDAAQWIRS